MPMTRSKNIKNKNFDYKSSIQDLKRIADDKRFTIREPSNAEGLLILLHSKFHQADQLIRNKKTMSAQPSHKTDRKPHH